MVVVQYSNSRITCLSTDTKPATQSAYAIAYETDTNLIYLTVDFGTTWTEHKSSVAKITGTLGIAAGGTGATTATTAFDALSSMTTLGDLIYGGASGTRTRLAGQTTKAKKVLTQLGTGSASAAPTWGTSPIFPSSGRKWGLIIPTVNPVTATANAGQIGLLDTPISLTGAVTYTSTLTDGGYWVSTTAATNPAVAGFRLTANPFYRGLNPRLKFKFKLDSLTASKIVLGFKPSAPQGQDDDPAFNTSMAAFGFSSTVNATNWIIWTNNGTGATETTNTTIAANTSYHTVEIVADDANAKFTYSLDEAAPVDMISTIPAQGTALCASFAVVTTETVVKNLTISWIEVEQDL